MSAFDDALISPRGVALIGASANPDKNTGRPQRFLVSHGYTGHVYPINPGRDEVQGVRSFKTVLDIDGPCDHAFIMVPGEKVIEAVQHCGEVGIPVATVYSDGFAEQGEAGRELQDQLMEAAVASGVRLLGPNSMGVICPASNLTLSVNAVLEMSELPKGRLGLISQSGTILGTLLSRGAARGIGFSRMLSVGNEADLGVGELVDVLVNDDATDAILLFLEAIRNPKTLADAARRAYAAGKPVIAYKLGRSQVGQDVALSHSGALAGEDKAVDAFFRANGIVRIETLEAIFEMPPMLIQRSPSRERRVAVVTTTGGGASTVVDRLGAFGLDVISPPDPVRERLKEFDLHIGNGPLVDLTMAGTREGVYGAALSELLQSDECDAVVCVVGSSAQFHPELAVAPIRDVAASARKPVAAFMVPQADESLRLLGEAGIAAFRTPEACADAVRAFFDWSSPQRIEADRPRLELSEHAAGTLDEAASLSLFQSLGIPAAKYAVISSDDDPVELSFPVAVKALTNELPHKTEAGAVELGVEGPEQLVAAIDLIRSRVAASKPGINLDRFLVEEMIEGVGEVLIGFRIDPQVGPIVVLAPGGVLAEIYGDSASRLAPIDRATAMAMISEVKGLRPLMGYRNLPRGDIDALAEALVRLSHLALLTSPPQEAEINPLIVGALGSGVTAVDGLVVIGRGG